MLTNDTGSGYLGENNPANMMFVVVRNLKA